MLEKAEVTYEMLTNIKELYESVRNSSTLSFSVYSLEEMKEIEQIAKKYGREVKYKDYDNVKVMAVYGGNELKIISNKVLYILEATEMFSYTTFSVIDLSNLDFSENKSTRDMFNNCHDLSYIKFGNFDTHNVETMSGMFNDCWRILQLDLSMFNTSKVKDMSHMFEMCYNLTILNVESFDTSNVKSMACMFHALEDLAHLDVTHFKTSNVEDMGWMFSGINYVDFDISNFDMSNVRSMEWMFAGCNFRNINLGEFSLKSLGKKIEFDSYGFYCRDLSYNPSNFNRNPDIDKENPVKAIFEHKGLNNREVKMMTEKVITGNKEIAEYFYSRQSRGEDYIEIECKEFSK